MLFLRQLPQRQLQAKPSICYTCVRTVDVLHKSFIRELPTMFMLMRCKMLSDLGQAGMRPISLLVLTAVIEWHLNA